MSNSELPAGRIARGLSVPTDPHWRVLRSRDLFELRYGKALVASSRRPGDVPVYGTNGRTGSHDKPLFAGPGVIIGRKGAYLGVEWSGEDYWVIDTAYSLKPSDEITLKYAYYMLKFVGLDHLQQGTSNPSLTREAFGSQYFPVPPVDEQERIAHTLSALDDKIKSNRSQIDTLFEIVKTHGAIESNKLPKVPLSKISTLRKKGSRISQFAGSFVDHYSLPAFDDGEFPVREMADEIKSNKILVDSPCVLVSRLNPRTRRIWWVDPSPDVVSLCSTEFALLQPVDGINLAAVWLAVVDKEFQDRMRASVTGTSGSHQRVAPLTIMGLEVPDFRGASLDVVKAVASLLNKTHALKSEIRLLEAVRNALLPELLSGRIRTTEVEDAVDGALS